MGDNSSADVSASSRNDSPVLPAFRAQDVSNDCLAQVIEAAQPADASWNLETWRWIVARGETSKRHLEAATLRKFPLGAAPVVVICLADTLAWKSTPRYLRELVAERRITEQEGRATLHRVREYYSSSPETARRTALAQAAVTAQQILLNAPQYNLSTYWITEFDEIKIRNHFHVPDNFVVTALLPMGYCTETLPRPTGKTPHSALIYNEKFGELIDPPQK